MSLILSLLLLLVLSRVLGEAFVRYRQPAMIGEILAGVLLGPSCFGAISVTPEIRAVAELGVLLLVFHAGMEMDPRVLRDSFRGRGAWVAICGFVVPLVFGLAVGGALGLDRTRTVFIGLCIAVTALPVSVRILMDLGKLRTDLGAKIISAAVANDVVALLVLGIVLDVKGGDASATGLLTAVAVACVKVVVFMVAVGAAGRLVRHLSRPGAVRPDSWPARLWRLVRGRESIFAITLLIVMAFAGLSEIAGLDFVVGAFFGSMVVSHELVGPREFEEIQKTASDVTRGFLGPIFFAAIGLQFDLSTLRDWRLVALVLVASFAGKILGGYAGGRLARLPGLESLTLGIGLNGRGIMELVIANVALANGFIGQQMFTVLVLMAIVTTFSTPILLKAAYARLAPEGPADGNPGPAGVVPE